MSGGCQGTEIGAALRAGGCGKATAPRNWVRVDALDGTRIVLDTMAQVRWAALSNRDPMGRFWYIRSLAIRGNVTLTGNGANAAVSAYQLRSVINQIDLTDCAGHKFYASADLRNIIDDCYYRHGRLPFALQGAVPAAFPAGNVSFPIDTEIPLVSRAAGASDLEGLIPVAALQMATMEALQFMPRSQIQGGPAGLTVVGFTRPDGTAGLEVWAEIVAIAPLEGDIPPVIDAPWMVRDYVLQGLDQLLEGDTRRHVYAHVRYRPEDVFQGGGGVVGQQLASLIDNMTLEVGGNAHFAALRAIDLAVRREQLAREGVFSLGDSADALGLPNLALPAEAGVTAPDVYTLAHRRSEDAPAGPVIVKFGTQPVSNTRWLHRMNGCDTFGRAEKIKAAMGCSCPVKVLPNTPNGSIDGSLPKLLVKA